MEILSTIVLVAVAFVFAFMRLMLHAVRSNRPLANVALQPTAGKTTIAYGMHVRLGGR